MKLNIIETINTVSWQEGVNNADATLVEQAKELANKGEPVFFGKVEGHENHWVLLTIGPDNKVTVFSR